MVLWHSRGSRRGQRDIPAEETDEEISGEGEWMEKSNDPDAPPLELQPKAKVREPPAHAQGPSKMADLLPRQPTFLVVRRKLKPRPPNYVPSQKVLNYIHLEIQAATRRDLRLVLAYITEWTCNFQNRM